MALSYSCHAPEGEAYAPACRTCRQTFKDFASKEKFFARKPLAKEGQYPAKQTNLHYQYSKTGLIHVTR